MRIVLIGTVLVALLGHPSHAQQTKSTHYCYDSLGRIEKATFHDNRQFVFTYDENHNLTHVQKTFSSDPSCSSFTAKSAPQGSAKAATGEAGDAQTASSPGRGRIPRPDDGDYAAPPLDVAVVTDRVTRPQAAPGSLGDRPRPKNAPLPPNVQRVRGIKGDLRGKYRAVEVCSRGVCAERIVDANGRAVAENGVWPPG